MRKADRREFLKKLMVGSAAVAATGASVAVASGDAKDGKHKSGGLYKRNATWEFYYKQAK